MLLSLWPTLVNEHSLIFCSHESRYNIVRLCRTPSRIADLLQEITAARHEQAKVTRQLSDVEALLAAERRMAADQAEAWAVEQSRLNTLLAESSSEKTALQEALAEDRSGLEHMQGHLVEEWGRVEELRLEIEAQQERAATAEEALAMAQQSAQCTETQTQELITAYALAASAAAEHAGNLSTVCSDMQRRHQEQSHTLEALQAEHTRVTTAYEGEKTRCNALSDHLAALQDQHAELDTLHAACPAKLSAANRALAEAQDSIRQREAQLEQWRARAVPPAPQAVADPTLLAQLEEMKTQLANVKHFNGEERERSRHQFQELQRQLTAANKQLESEASSRIPSAILQRFFRKWQVQ